MNTKSWLPALAAVLIASVASKSAQADLIATDPVPDDVTALHNGLRWAWASPVSTRFFGLNELKPPEFHDGWRYATVAEMLSIPDISLFQALPDGSAAAVPYWNTELTHVDESDYTNGNVTSQPIGDPYTTFDTLYVSGDSAPADVVPEPGSLALLGLGSLGVIGAHRRRRKRRFA